MDWGRHLVRNVLQNRIPVLTVLFKGNQKVLEMNFDTTLRDAVMMPSNWEELGIWEPTPQKIANVTNHLQTNITGVAPRLFPACMPRSCI
jgi:hypothetical protein